MNDELACFSFTVRHQRPPPHTVPFASSPFRHFAVLTAGEADFLYMTISGFIVSCESGMSKKGRVLNIAARSYPEAPDSSALTSGANTHLTAGSIPAPKSCGYRSGTSGPPGTTMKSDALAASAVSTFSGVLSLISSALKTVNHSGGLGHDIAKRISIVWPGFVFCRSQASAAYCESLLRSQGSVAA